MFVEPGKGFLHSIAIFDAVNFYHDEKENELECKDKNILPKKIKKAHRKLHRWVLKK
jgi:hypothetical protein